jgi:hypothetical protein
MTLAIVAARCYRVFALADCMISCFPRNRKAVFDVPSRIGESYYRREIRIVPRDVCFVLSHQFLEGLEGGENSLALLVQELDDKIQLERRHATERVAYTKADVKELRAHSKAKTPVVKIAKLTKRSVGSLRQKALKLGIRLGHRR